MKKIILIIIAITIPVLMFAEWGDEEENGGVYQWAPIKPYNYEPYAHFYEMSVLDSTYAIALMCRGTFGKFEIWETNDACKSWNIIYSELDGRIISPAQLSCPDTKHIFATGYASPNYYILKSRDAGINWDTIITPHYYFGGHLIMYDSLIGVCKESFKLEENTNYADTNIFLSKIAYTTDGCKTWETFRPDSVLEEALGVNQFHFFSPEHFGVLSYNAGEFGDGPIYFWTEDKGETWEITYISPRNGLEPNMTPQPEKMYFLNDSIGWICADQWDDEKHDKYDILFKTTDSGRSWELKYKELNSMEFGLQDIKFINENDGIAVGGMGKVLRTTDGGETWVQEYGKDPEHIKCPEGKITSAHLYTHGVMRIEYFGTKPIIWTRNANYPLWEYNPFTVGVGYGLSKSCYSRRISLLELRTSFQIPSRNL
jgi:photosystem II stability/assembly factor-like uncharacterized protein